MNTNLSRALAIFALIGLNHAISLEAKGLNLAEVESFTAQGEPAFNFDSDPADGNILPSQAPALSVDVVTPENGSPSCGCKACKNCDIKDCLKFDRKCPEPNVPDATFKVCDDGCCDKHRCYNTKYEDSFCLEGKSQT
jgi:hypothetical protein